MTKLARKLLLAVTLLPFLSLAIAAGSHNQTEKSATTPMTVDEVVRRHIAAHGGEKPLRDGQTFWFTVTRDWDGEKTMKTVYQTRPEMMRTDAHTSKGQLSFAYDGKVAWRKRGIAPAAVLSAEETQQMKTHMKYDGIELAAGPLFAPLRLPDAVKDATSVKLKGTKPEAGSLAWVIEIKNADGEVERFFVDTKSFLLLRREESYEKDGKLENDFYRYSDYKDVAGRMFNHSFEYGSAGKSRWKSLVSNISADKSIDVTAYAMPK